MTNLDDSIGAYMDALQSGRHVLAGLEMREVETGDDTWAVEVTVDETTCGPAGSFHGGLLATVVDYVGARIATNQTQPGELVVTSDMTVHFLGPLKSTAHAVGTVVKRGKRQVVVRVDVHDGRGGRVGATSTLQFSIIRPEL
jgi:uncharacterized protein (TIGR00369 family)